MKILIVDDTELNRDILQDMLEEAGYETLAAADGAQAWDILREQHGDIQAVLMDLIMPRMDGFSLLEKLRTQSWFSEIPVIVISSDNEQSAEDRSLELGANDFIHKPFARSIVLRRVRNAIQLFSQKNSLERLVAQQTHALRVQSQKIQSYNEKIIDILGTVVEYRNLESGEHILRVKGFTHILAQTMMKLFPDCGLTPKQAALIVAASPLHDVGKITIPDHILLKPGRLTPEEFDQMKEHTTNGADMLRRIQGAWEAEYAQTCYEICRYHHERHNGKGYPDGLKGDEIPISAQLVSLADVYDALVTKRVYKDAYSYSVAYDMIQNGECGVFSPRLLACFAHARPEMERLSQSAGPELEAYRSITSEAI